MTLFTLGPLNVIRNPRQNGFIVRYDTRYLDFIPYPGQTGLGMAISKCHQRVNNGAMQ